MAKQIFINGSGLYVKDTITNSIEFSRPADECWYDEGYLQQGRVVLTHLGRPSHNYDISETIDENGVVFTEQSFRDFADNNLGENSGGGSADLSTKIGFIDYNDASTSTTPITLIQDTWTDVPNDGLGAFTNKGYSPVNELLDGSTGYLDFSELTLGSDLLIRIDFEVTPQTNNALLESRYVLGTAPNDYALPIRSRRLDSGSGTPYSSEKGAFYIYMGDNNTLNGVGKLQVKLSSNGTLKNNGVAIKIYKK